ncbi:MAG: HAMP domain-containing histidine kinase [Lachnospiraceae bacterium]|nr:HAMP domain-containing histidine kinase [Lachnospiraceae bacterium]
MAKNIYEKCTEINEYIEKIIQTAHENLLNFEVKNDEFYLSDFIKEIEKFYTEKLDLLKINFSIAPFQNQLLKGDFERAVEVLQNLIENALKYGDGKEISLHFEREEDCLLLSVKNSGSTISDSELPHIFESFWRGSNAGTSSGSGLGLYICRELMRKMNGEIFAETENETMSVTAVFPLV